MNRKIVIIAIDEIRDHPQNAEIYGETVPDPDLVESIKERGVLQACIVAPSTSGYRMVSGHRRKAAAREAGLTHIPAEVRHYRGADEELIDLIHSNKHRKKTSKQVNDEVVRLKSALSKVTKANSVANLKRGNSEDGLPSGPIEPLGETNANIAEKTGLSQSEIKRRTMVCDPEYRKGFFDELRKLGGNNELVKECGQQWAAIHRTLDTDELAVSAAANQVKKLQKEFRELCPDYKPAKTTAKKVPATKSAVIKWADTTLDEDADEWVLAEVVDVERDVEAGILKRGSMHVPGFRIGNKVQYVEWAALLKVAKIKKAA